MPPRGAEDSRKLLPRELVVRERAAECSAFAANFPLGRLLLIDVESAESELAAGLREVMALTAEALSPTADGLAYGTSVRYPAAPASSARKVAPRSDRIGLATLLARRCFFGAPLVKRVVAGKPFSNRISVGRARNNDIVLRDQSVSKFHAWFELDDEQKLYLGDAQSTNKTHLNSVVVRRDMVEVAPGDEIRFGDVWCTLCSAEMLWEALQS